MSKKKLVVLLPQSLDAPPGFDEVPELVNLVLTKSTSDAVREISDAHAYFQWDFTSTAIHQATVFPNLSWIHAASLGVDTLLTPEIVDSRVQVTNTRGVYEYPIAEYVLAMMLFHFKDFATTLDLKAQKRWSWRPTHSLQGKTVAIIGPGAIGSEIDKLLTAVGVNVVSVGRTPRAGSLGERPVHGVTDLPFILSAVDGVVLALPLTDETEGFMSEERFSMMRQGSFFINIGRGKLVDENALFNALGSRKISFAGLDVFATEPLPESSPFWELPNVFVSPHMSADVYGWRDKISQLFVANLKRWLNGEELLNIVDKTKFSKNK